MVSNICWSLWGSRIVGRGVISDTRDPQFEYHRLPRFLIPLNHSLCPLVSLVYLQYYFPHWHYKLRLHIQEHSMNWIVVYIYLPILCALIYFRFRCKKDSPTHNPDRWSIIDTIFLRGTLPV